LPEAESGRLYNSLELAYLGDAVYDLHVRRRLLKTGGRLSQLHREAVSKVRASAQSLAFERVEPILTDEELDIARRARNAKQTPPHSASPAEYCRATALEALLGYLYLSGRNERLEEIIGMALSDEGCD
jgi:ribonuclease-3 family protein